MKNILLFFVLLYSANAFAQTKITGTVKDTKGKPLKAVSIAIKGSYDGITADSLGNYSFATDEKGEQIIEATLVSYRTAQKTIACNGTALVIDLVLKELVNELKAVTVTAGLFEAGDKKRSTILTSLDIVTTASAQADVTSALKTLPGTQSVGESEGLFVRGGTATESKIFIDGTQVNNFFYSSTPGISSRGRFNPFLFKGTAFSTGGYSALYGQALSSALVLESIDLPDQSSANIGITVVGLSGGLQQLSKNKKSSYGFTYNHTNLALAFAIVPQIPEYYKTPVFNDVDANFRIKTSKTGMLKYYGYFSNSNIGIKNPDIDSSKLKNAFKVNNTNTYHNISIKDKIGKGLRLNAGLSYSNNKDNIANELQNADNVKAVITTPSFYQFKNFALSTKSDYVQARIVLEKKLPGINALRFGLENSYSNEKNYFTLYNGVQLADTVKENLTALFAETDIYVTNSLALKLGTRAEYSNLLAQANIAPRVALAYKLNTNTQLSFASGTFYQNPDRRNLPTPLNVNFSKANHYILQYFLNSKDYTLRSELFYKKYNALYKTSSAYTGKDVVVNTDGNGYAKGFELFWRDRKSIKGMDYWVSYSYLDTKRNFNNYPTTLQPTFAAKHTASFVLKQFVLKWKTGFNASYTFATGRPYYNIKYNNTTNTNYIADQGKTINFNSLSFSLNYLPYLGKTNSKKFAVLVLSVSNVLGQNQVFSYNYNNDGSIKVPVTPPSKRFLFVGCFINIGVDRTQDAINGNL